MIANDTFVHALVVLITGCVIYKEQWRIHVSLALEVGGGGGTGPKNVRGSRVIKLLMWFYHLRLLSGGGGTLL